MIILNGINRFKIFEEVSTDKLYRLCKVDYESYIKDQDKKVENMYNENLDTIFKDLKIF